MSRPPETNTADGPLLALIRRLARTALAATAPGGTGVRLAEAEPLADGLRLHLRVQGMGGLLDTTVRLRLVIRDVGATSTRCTLELDDAERRGGLGRLLGTGLGALPRPLLQQALAKVAGDAVRLEEPGTTSEMALVLDHAALLRRLRGAN